jgi:hypothetical protein
MRIRSTLGIGHTYNMQPVHVCNHTCQGQLKGRHKLVPVPPDSPEVVAATVLVQVQQQACAIKRSIASHQTYQHCILLLPFLVVNVTPKLVSCATIHACKYEAAVGCLISYSITAGMPGRAENRVHGWRIGCKDRNYFWTAWGEEEELHRAGWHISNQR